MSEVVEEPILETAEPKEGGNAKTWAVRIAAIVLVLMVAEAVAMYFLFASEAEAASAEEEAAAQIADGISDITAGSDLIEVAFEPAFAVSNSTADLTAMVHVNFELVAGVAGKNESVFREAVENDYRNRLRQAVGEIMRSASLEELQDPDLNQIKRRIKEDLNKTLQSSYVVDVIVPKMQIHIQ